ncbi:hypothetical protein EHEL_090220 [Encephalitozoon hellem ATCC 50504]|uniref:DUF5095 domain-containing protein n=1 Tax=Encephalitozoon hellem TaxID=27973 RepID=A0A9Q9FC62_ENCHE|nr:uncharacterized protein EHEL_090220 [Encephalitozoon hellem ATCC 50504]AFM98918.1 hypothetical protein EHEL_090220 [Encephalitozoon hellem ATCC 50504]UTX43930.1 DUF5095 domain-containing protein [Encephalitozoon hellem]|eukprot:XP_003887899.1 hypothetical protein EHEL_090220 [Encephalitozoon hellem ATCC 50504]
MENMEQDMGKKGTCMPYAIDKGGQDAKRECRTNVGINALSKISDNPFDVLSQSLYKKSEVSCKELPSKKSLIEDSIFEELLLKPKAKPKTESRKMPYGIFTSMALVADKEIQVGERRMYKFPFEVETKNDGSQLFEKMYSEYLIAAKSVFKEYKRSNIRFYMKLKNDFLLFDSYLRASSGMKKDLIKNEIEFKEEGTFLIVKGIEVALVFDYIINIPMSPSFSIPFILSENQFENGILFSVRLQKRRAIREGKKILYSYELQGPFWAEDYKELVDLHTRIV